MYYSYFGMKERPFAATPQLGSFFPAAGQEEALATLHYCITEGRGVALVTGDTGTGKSLICHRLACSLTPAFSTAIITNTNMTSVKALLQSILYDLTLPYRGLDEQELRLMLTDYLLGKYAGGGRTVLIVDEAQNLGVPLLEELRMLGNLEGETDKLFQIVLAGHTRLGRTLRQPELATFNQRIGARATITAFGDEETCNYIMHQLQSAGAVADAIFTYDAMSAVYEATGGVARLINQLCERALLLAYVAEAPSVDAEIVEQANGDLAEFDSEPTVAADELASSVTMVAPASETVMAPSDEFALSETVVADTAPIYYENPAYDEPFDLVRAPEPCAGDCLEMLERPPAELIEPSARVLDIAPKPARPRQKPLVEDEEVIDHYAMMDDARATSKRRPAAIRTRRDTAEPDEPREDGLPLNRPATSKPKKSTAVATLVPPAQVLASSRDTQMTGPSAADTEPLFVNSNDNPAVHEVGAGVVAQADSPILVIDRPQRAPDNSIRMDGPQSPAGGSATYRRLFSNARKS